MKQISDRENIHDAIMASLDVTRDEAQELLSSECEYLRGLMADGDLSFIALEDFLLDDLGIESDYIMDMLDYLI